MTQTDLKPLNIGALLAKYDIRPSKGLGQNFLSNIDVLNKIIDEAHITKEDVVLEIGPGLGSLTRQLAQQAKQVIAVELDRKMMAPLEEVLAPFNNVTVIQDDILKVDLDEVIPMGGYKVVANIPYYITSAVIRQLLEAEKKPTTVVLTVQKEVAQRMCAVPNEMNLLAVSVQVYGTPRFATTIPAGAFYPVPKVDSAVICVELFEEPILRDDMTAFFFSIVKAGFSQRRKTLRNTISAGMHWEKAVVEQELKAASVDPMRRAETLSIEEWVKITERFSNNEQ